MARWLRRAGIALLCSLLAGFAFGTCVRWRAERPTVYIGMAGAPPYSSSTLTSRIDPVKASYGG